MNLKNNPDDPKGKSEAHGASGRHGEAHEQANSSAPSSTSEKPLTLASPPGDAHVGGVPQTVGQATAGGVPPPTGKSGGGIERPIRHQEPVTVSLRELRTMTVNKNQFLIEGFLPRVGLALLVAQPDTGKSMFAKRLALAIARRDETFLGMNLRAEQGGAIMISTEDGREDTQRTLDLMYQDIESLSPEQEERVRFIFTESLSPDEILEQLETALMSGPSDIAFVDVYGDVFSGKDANSNSEVRKFMAKYYKLAQEYKTLIVFIHHINKSGYNDRPSQIHVQGASALSQKVRTIFQLLSVPGDDDHRYLLVIKGNGLSRQHKRNAIELHFDETTLNFSHTGRTKPIEEFGEAKDGVKDRSTVGPSLRDHEHIFRPGEYALGYNEIVRRIVNTFNVAPITAKRDIKDYFLKEADGTYSTPESSARKLRDGFLQAGYVNETDASGLSTLVPILGTEQAAAIAPPIDLEVFFQGEDSRPIFLERLIDLVSIRFRRTRDDARAEILAKCRRSGPGTGDWETHANFKRRIRRTFETLDDHTIVPEAHAPDLREVFDGEAPPEGQYKIRYADGTLRAYEDYLASLPSQPTGGEGQLLETPGSEPPKLAEAA